MKKRDGFLFGVFLFLVSAVTPVHAYLDPGTGSFILQMLLGGAAGAALLVKVYWQKLLSLFGLGSAGDVKTGDATLASEDRGD